MIIYILLYYNWFFLIVGDVPEEGYSQEISCNSSGDYEINANISNLWSYEVVSTEFHCFSSIGRDWTLDSDSPKAVPPGILIFIFCTALFV